MVGGIFAPACIARLRLGQPAPSCPAWFDPSRCFLRLASELYPPRTFFLHHLQLNVIGFFFSSSSYLYYPMLENENMVTNLIKKKK